MKYSGTLTMGTDPEFHRVVASKFPGRPIEQLKWWNAVRLPGTPSLIAKLVPFDIDDPSDQARADQAHATEVGVYKMLPDWWGTRYVTSFPEERIIVTEEFKNCPWGTRKVSPAVVTDLTKQLQWLHDNGILHNDIELKNILLSCDGTQAVLIDFEKSKRNPSDAEKAEEMKRLLEILPRGGRRTRKRTRRRRTLRKRVP